MSFLVTASRIAFRWLSANVIFIFRSAHPIAASTFAAGSGCGPRASALTCRATPSSARNSGLR